MNVLIIPEDFIRDEHVLLPIIKQMMAAIGRPKARITVCKDPRLSGTNKALKWEWIEQVLNRHRGMVDLFLLCVDRDGDPTRRASLDRIEVQANAKLGAGRLFLAEHAWQELEVWILAGHDLPAEWTWKEIRAERDPKERFFLPFAKLRGVLDRPAEGRGALATEAASRYPKIRKRCPEDVQSLESRIKAHFGPPPSR